MKRNSDLKTVSVILALVTLGALGLSACTSGGTPTTTGVPPIFTTTANTEQLYLNQCAECHGADRSGGLGPDIRVDAPAMKDFSSAPALYDRIADHFPAQDLGPDAQRQLAAYLFQESH